MPRQSMNLLCSYRYDPLDRLVTCTPSTQASTQRFYVRNRLVTEIQGTVQRSIMQHDDQLLAQKQRQGSTAVETSLLATDQQRSVLNALDTTKPGPLAYTPYGHRPLGNGLLGLLGYNGENPDPVTGWYLLGTGHHRPFNPVLGCFICPDSWSPFGAGGLNVYAYCLGDPINRRDPTGQFSIFPKGRDPFKGFANLLGRTSRRERANRAYEAALQTPVDSARSQPNSGLVSSPSPSPPSREHRTPRPSYTQSQTDVVLLASRDSSTPTQGPSPSTPNLEFPPPYFRYESQRPIQPHQQALYRHQLNGLLAQRQRHMGTTMEQFSSANTELRWDLDDQILDLRLRLNTDPNSPPIRN